MKIALVLALISVVACDVSHLSGYNYPGVSSFTSGGNSGGFGGQGISPEYIPPVSRPDTIQPRPFVPSQISDTSFGSSFGFPQSSVNQNYLPPVAGPTSVITSYLAPVSSPSYSAPAPTPLSYNGPDQSSFSYAAPAQTPLSYNGPAQSSISYFAPAPVNTPSQASISVNQDYLPPTFNQISPPIQQQQQQTAILANDGYHYKSARHYRLRRF